MPENQQNHSNVGSILSNGPVNNIQEGIIMKMEKQKKKEGEETIEYPERPGEQDCYYYLRHGTCGYAANCRFNHPPLSAQCMLPQREGQPDCGHYVKTGNCKYGPTCKYHHPLDRRGAEDIIFNSLGLPIRKTEKACPYYISYQKCKFGAACKFDHPELNLIETASPVSQAISQAKALGIGPSSPSNGIPYVGAFSTWPWTSSSCFPAPQPYMPYLIPALQGAVAIPNLNNYPQGNMSSMAGPNVMGTNLFYNCKNPGEMVPGGQWDLSTMTTCNLPERPDQPDCRYFMRNGGCKYGSKCRFHHPKEMVVHNFGPHGLPSRPGEDVSAYYPYGYISGYYLSMPPATMLVSQNQPFLPRKLTITSSTETSQSKSSKITEWIQKPESENRQDSTTKPVEDSDEKVNDQSSAANTAPNDEIPQDQSN